MYRLLNYEHVHLISHIEDGTALALTSGGSQGMRPVPYPPKPDAVLLAAPGFNVVKESLFTSFIHINGGLL